MFYIFKKNCQKNNLITHKTPGYTYFPRNALAFFVEGYIDFRNLNEDNFKYSSVMQSETWILRSATPATQNTAASPATKRPEPV